MPDDTRALRAAMLLIAATMLGLAAMPAAAQPGTPTFEGKPVRIGNGSAHTIVRTDATGKAAAIGIVFTPAMLQGLPQAAPGRDPDFPYVLAMPAKGPRTVVDHVVINWESQGHVPAHVYDVPHFDFHFYLVTRDAHARVKFKDASESAHARQQPPARLMPAGYILPPGTAVPGMGVHAIDPASHEFHGQPFTATFIYGYYNRVQTFVEPMVSLAFLQSKQAFAAPVVRPAAYTKPGRYPSAYAVRYDTARDVYEVTLEELK
jgi:hypothetical protein